MADLVTKTLHGKKMQMSQIFNEGGKVVPVTAIKIDESQKAELTEDLVSTEVVLVGKSKGKGFTGVMKKWNFAGQQATRGQSNKPRAAGSIGSQSPSRVWKGKKMAGRHGNAQITLKGLKIVKVLPEYGQLFLNGPVPGARNSLVKLTFNAPEVSDVSEKAEVVEGSNE